MLSSFCSRLAVFGLSQSLASTRQLYKLVAEGCQESFSACVRLLSPWRLGELAAAKSSPLAVYNPALFDPMLLASWACRRLASLNLPSLCSYEVFWDIEVSSRVFNASAFFPGSFTYRTSLKQMFNASVVYNSFYKHLEKYYRSKLTLIHK